MLILNILSILLVAVILIVIISVLININRKLDKKIQLEKSRIEFYQKQIKKIRSSSSPQNSIKQLNDLAREFFKEKLSLKYSKTYIELAEIFKKKRKNNEENFCNSMNEIMYSKTIITMKRINELIDMFAEIVEEYNTFKN